MMIDQTVSTQVECRTLFNKRKIVPLEKLELRAGVYAIILHEQKILLLTVNETGKYCFPGGGVELGEPMTKALHREVKEEAGVEIEIGDLIHFQEDFFYYDPKDLAFHGLLFYYLCQPVTFDLLLPGMVDDECSDHPQWIAIPELVRESFQSQEQWLFDWLKTI